MAGSFTSAAQAAADSAYHAVTLHMVPIWRDRAGADTTYLYVEQALASAPERPYRQRVYRVSPLPDGRWASAVYTLPDAGDYVGKWRTPAAFDALAPAALTEREGCTVFLARRPDGSFRGSTDARACGSTLRGATYATSEVTVRPGLVESWDRGYDADGRQVWGAEAGPYVFRRE